jgi:hypothetical protein
MAREKRQVEDRLQALSDEFQREDAEMAEAANYRRLWEEKSQQVVPLQDEVGRLRAEVATALERDAAAKVTSAERNKLQSTVTEQQKQLLKQLDRTQSTEQKLSVAQSDFEALKEERDLLLQEFHGVLEQVNSQGVSVQFQADHLDSENVKLREQVKLLQATLTTKETAIERIKEQLEDQTLLVQSLHAERAAEAEQTGYTGSLMNEIEHLVMAQLQNAEPADERLATPPPAPEADPATAPSTPIQEPGFKERTEERTVEIEPDGPGVTSARKGSAAAGRGSPIKNVDSPGRAGATAATSRPSMLQDRLQVYAAASANHLSGNKIITPAVAEKMDIPSLLKTASALQDLIDTRSTVLGIFCDTKIMLLIPPPAGLKPAYVRSNSMPLGWPSSYWCHTLWCRNTSRLVSRTISITMNSATALMPSHNT